MKSDILLGRGGEIRRIEQGTPFLDGPGYTYMRRVGKKVAGRLLDGREWSQIPEVWHGA